MKKALPIFLSICLGFSVQPNLNIYANENLENIQITNESVKASLSFDELAQGAKFYKNYKTDSSLGGAYFDGSRVEDYTSEIANINALSEGTIMMKVKLDSAYANNNRYMFNAMSTDNGITEKEDAFFNYSKANNCFRYNFYNGMMSNTSVTLKDDLYHKIIYTAEKAPDNKTYVRVSIDGLTTNDWGNKRYDGFFGQNKTSPAKRLTIGGTNETAETNFVGNIDYVMVTDKVLTMDEMKTLSKPDEGDTVTRDDLLFYPGDATGSEYFRIPSLYTTSEGTVVASIDARFGGGSDSPNNLDTTVRRSLDGGNTWDDAFLTNHFVDYPDVAGYKSGSASFIDPVVFEDETNKRLFMVVDAFPTGGGIWGQCEGGSAFDDAGNLKIRLKDETEYNYIAVKKSDNTGYDIKKVSGESTEYSLNGKLEVFKNGAALTVAQDSTGAQVPMNIFYANSDLRILGTSYLYMTHSDDEGLTWSDPIILDGMKYQDTKGQTQQIKDPSMRFFGVGPGTGIQLKIGDHTGRLLFPAYQFIHDTPGDSQRSALVYSDDGGVTWARSELVDTVDTSELNGAYMSESVPVELPDGSILLLGRTNGGKIGQVVSTDGGATWQDKVSLVDEIPSNDCQISAINYSKTIDGKPAIIVSSPQHPGRRFGGVIDIGLISENGTYQDGSKKYSIEWKYKYDINDPTEPFKYSCLTELPNGDLMIMYESTGDSDIPYAKFTINEIIDQEAKLVFSDSNVSNSKQISGEDLNKINALEDGTIVVKFTENTTSNIAPLFGFSNAGTNEGFYIYSGGTKAGFKFLNGSNDISYLSNDRSLNNKGLNTIAFKADRRASKYTIFANGELLGSKKLTRYEFLNSFKNISEAYIGKFKDYSFDGLIESIDIYDRPMSDDELVEITAKTPPIIPPQDNDKIFYKGDATNANYFRIPSILTTKDGTTIAAIDARFGGVTDSPNNLDTAVRRSSDNGLTWDTATLPNHFIDYPDIEGFQKKSASFIDAVMLENKEGRVFMLVDAFPTGAGLMSKSCETGSGYAPKTNSSDTTKYLKLQWGSETTYKNRAIPNGDGTYTINNGGGNDPTQYTMNGKFDLFNNGVPMMMQQKGTGKQIPMNAFYEGATFYLQKTSYLYLVHSDDQGKTWSDPTILNGMVKDDNMTFLGTGPGTGIQLKNGEHAGRLLFPVYQYEYDTSLSGNAQRSALIYSDDNGVTWTRGDFVDLEDGLSAMSESVPVELLDGSIMLFGRTYGGKVGQAISKDGGATWTAKASSSEITAPYSQMTAINYSELIDGKPAIILASASHPSDRVSGVINIGLINDDNTINWKYKAPINAEGEAYGYSCVTELSNGDIMVFYEGSDSGVIPHKVMSIDEIKGSVGEETVIVNDNKALDYTITVEATDTTKGTVSVKVVNKDTKSVTIPATVKDNKNRDYDVSILEDNAFAGCSSLIDLTIPATIKTIKNSMFSACTSLQFITILSETLTVTDNLTNIQQTAKFIVKTTAIKDALVAKGIKEENILVDDGQSATELRKAIDEANAVLKDEAASVDKLLNSIKNLSDAIVSQKQ